MCHVSHVTCHMSHVMCHMSLLFFWTNLWSLSVEGLLSTGPTPSSFYLYPTCKWKQTNDVGVHYARSCKVKNIKLLQKWKLHIVLYTGFVYLWLKAFFPPSIKCLEYFWKLKGCQFTCLAAFICFDIWEEKKIYFSSCLVLSPVCGIFKVVFQV